MIEKSRPVLDKILWCKTTCALLVCWLGVLDLAAQKSNVQMYVESGGQLSFSKNFDFVSADKLSWVIETDRSAPYGTVNFSVNTLSVSGTDDAHHIDGYVRKLGTSSFLFPVGHKGFYGPFLASADETTGAYFRADASGAGFQISSVDIAIGSVSPIEYWDIDGKNKTKISLTWDSQSKTEMLTKELSQLTIAGWQNGKWIEIPSKVDSISVLGGKSNLQAGSITTIDAFAPNDFEVYTLAGKAEPTVSIDTPLTDLTVYPNPANETLKFAQSKTAQLLKRETLKITDILGHDHTESVYWVKNDLHIGNLVRGIYIVTFLDQSGNSIHSRFLISR